MINATCYTAANSPQDDAERAMPVNVEAAGEVAAAAGEVGARFVQISTG